MVGGGGVSRSGGGGIELVRSEDSEGGAVSTWHQRGKQDRVRF